MEHRASPADVGSSEGLGVVPLHKMPLCDCANHGAKCLRKKAGQACMAHDNWYTQPCDRGQCPGPMNSGCCNKPHPDAWMDEFDV